MRKWFTFVEMLIVVVSIGSIALFVTAHIKENNNTCSWSWHTMRDYWTNWFWETLQRCMSDQAYKDMRFDRCSRSCDIAIDDNRDLTISNAYLWTVECLKMCME